MKEVTGLLDKVAQAYGFTLWQDGEHYDLYICDTVVGSVDTAARLYEVQIYIDGYVRGYQDAAQKAGRADILPD